MIVFAILNLFTGVRGFMLYYLLMLLNEYTLLLWNIILSTLQLKLQNTILWQARRRIFLSKSMLKYSPTVYQ